MPLTPLTFILEIMILLFYVAPDLCQICKITLRKMEEVFLPSNITFLISSMDQGHIVSCCHKLLRETGDDNKQTIKGIVFVLLRVLFHI